MTFDEIARGLTNAINKYKGKMVGVGEIRIDDMAEDCLRFIREQQKQLDEEISRRYQAECNYDSWKKQAMEYKEKLEQLKIKQHGWIHVSEGLPEIPKNATSLNNYKRCLCTTANSSVSEMHFVRRTLRGKEVERWEYPDGKLAGLPWSEVIAWQPLPEPYHIGGFTDMFDSAEIRGMKNENS